VIDATAAGNLLSRLDGVRKTASGWSAKCPAHADQNASLSIDPGDNGGLLLHCHAGCATEAVVQALGMKMADLMPAEGVGQNEQQLRRRIIAQYPYRDENGKLLFEAVRYSPKDFKQRKPNDDGGWVWKLNGTPRVPYRLPELLAADPGDTIFIPEGEKDCESLAALGLVATCNVGGAGKWKPEYSEFLRGRNVAILPDNDDTGREHAETVANSTAGIAASVKVIDLPGLPEKGDVSDWLAAGGTADALAALTEAAPEWKPTSTKPRTTKRTKAPVVVGEPKAPTLWAASGRNDTANGRRLAQKHGPDILWCDPFGAWYCWDGSRWLVDNQRKIEAIAKTVPDALWQEVQSAASSAGNGAPADMAKFVCSTANYRGIQNMIAAVKSEPGISILPAQLDSFPWLLNCQNGTLDLKTGALRPARREDLLTKIVPHEFLTGPEAECPLFEEFLWRVCDENADLIRFIRRLFGMALVGQSIEQVLPIFFGRGANGKSVLIETMLYVFGDDYGYKAPPDLLIVKKNEAHPAERAELHGRRFVACVETEENRRLSESLVKELTGSDSITARQFYQKFFTFRPSHTVFLVTNHRPIVKGTDEGVWRRPKLVPFTVTIPPDEQDRHLTDKLKAEAPAILSWCVHGCLQWQAEGLGEPETVKAATAEYRASQDVLAAFFDECCVFGEQYTAKAADVRKRYETWCDQNGERPVSGRKFGEVLTEREVRRYTNNGTWYDGFGLVD
jgi:putative DNA primase/helicase